MILNHLLKTSLFLSVLLLFQACGDTEPMLRTQFGIFKVLNETTLEMDGEIADGALDDFNALIEQYPDVKTIQIKEVPGSSNDDINLPLSKKVHDRRMAIHLNDNGMIASGGVDFFLAGTTRTKGSNTQIGVHSWGNGTIEATDFPRGHANHQRYIDYYQYVGFTLANAEAFYYFTIDAAPAADIHWMTDAEIAQYGLLTP